MILAGFSRGRPKAFDSGELVCIFPEGQITRTGMTLPFQRGLERIVKGRTVPIIPVHIDRANASIFSPMNTKRLPDRIPLPITVSFGTPLPPTTPLREIRQAIEELDGDAWAHRKADRRPLHHEFIRRARLHPFRLAMADLITAEVSVHQGPGRLDRPGPRLADEVGGAGSRRHHAADRRGRLLWSTSRRQSRDVSW